MQLNPAEISELIKSRIEGLGVSADIKNQGTVVTVTDGICRIHGLSDAMQGEMLEFPPNAAGQPTYGLALNREFSVTISYQQCRRQSGSLSKPGAYG